MAILGVTIGVEAENTGQTLECLAPANIVDGNILRIIASASNDVNISVNEVGWTQVNHVKMTAGINGALAIFIKEASSESGTYTIDIDGGVDYSIIAQCSQYSGIDTTTPQDAVSTSLTDQNDTSIDPTSITTINDGAFVESVIWARAGSITIPDAPTGYTKFGAEKRSNAYLGSAYKEVVTAASEDPGIWSTFTVTADSCGITWAMRPTGGSGGAEEMPLIYRRKRNKEIITL